jgi:thioredoxin 1
MFALTSFRRAILTTTRSRIATASQTNFYRLIVIRQFFHNTSRKMGVQNLESKSKFDEALNDNKFVVLDCFATWCGPCKIISPVVEKYSGIYTNAKFFKLDVDEVPDVSQELGIRAMPTFLFFKDGEKVGEVVGANPKAIEAAIKKNFPEEEDA